MRFRGESPQLLRAVSWMAWAPV